MIELGIQHATLEGDWEQAAHASSPPLLEIPGPAFCGRVELAGQRLRSVRELPKDRAGRADADKSNKMQKPIVR